MVIFTEPKFAKTFLEWRSAYSEKTIVVTLPRTEFRATRWGGAFWEMQKTLDHEEAHSAELYKIWYEKKEFVLRAIGMEAFHAKKFVWCDAGILRFPECLAMIQSFPRENMIENGKMSLLQIAPFEEGDTSETSFQYVNRIGGGIQAADSDTWKWWADAYDVMMKRFIASERFCGKDQSIMASIVLENREKINLVNPPETMHPVMKWFYLLFYFSGIL